jgi:hypothetical protein
MTSANIIISAGDALTINAQAGQFTYRFPYAYPSSGEERISLRNLSIFYSWANLTSTFNNLTGLSYKWLDGVSYPVVYPAGFYSLGQLNEYLRFTMKQNNHYLVDATGTEVYYLSFVVNQVYYGCTLTCSPFPTALPVGWSNPGSTAFYPSGYTPQFVVDGATNWRTLIGFDAGIYPPSISSTVMNYNSQSAPIASPITQVLVLCDWVSDGRFSNQPSVIASFVPSVGFGEIIDYSPPVLTFYSVARRVYTGVKISLVDQNYRPLAIQDASQATFTLLVQ